MGRVTIDRSTRPAVVRGMKAKNNGRYNGNGRHWETPPEVFEPLNSEFAFTLDPCCTVETAKCAQFFDDVADGLSRPWTGHRVYMNPPYGREVYAWTRKARLEVAAGCPLVVGLLPASSDLAWWHDDIIGPDPRNPLAEVRYIRGRVRFLTGGPYRASGFFASVIAIWRSTQFHPATAPATSHQETTDEP